MKSLLALLTLISVLCLASYAQDPAPPATPAKTAKEIKIEANGVIWSAKIAAIETKKAQGKHAEALAEAQNMLANPPYAEFSEGEKWALKTYHIPLLMAQPYADDAACRARAQDALDYCHAAQAEKWDTITNARDKITAAYQLLAWSLVDIDGAMAELDKAIAAGTTEEQIDAWSLKVTVLVQYAQAANFPAEKRAEWGKAAIAACGKVLLLKPGHYGAINNDPVGGAVGIWKHIETLAPQYLDPSDYLILCKKILMSYPPAGQSVDDWAAFISRVSFRKESLQ